MSYYCFLAPTAPPQNISVISNEPTMIQLTFLPPPAVDQNGLIVSYTVVLRGNPFDTEEQTRSISVMSEYPATSLVDTILTGFEENNNYTLTVSAATEAGEGPPSEQFNITTGIGGN